MIYYFLDAFFFFFFFIIIIIITELIIQFNKNVITHNSTYDENKIK